jgi:hypothetical protein
MVISNHITKLLADERIADLQREAADHRIVADRREPKIGQLPIRASRRASKKRRTFDLGKSWDT